MYEEVEGLQVVPESGKFSENFPAAAGGSLIAVAGKNGVVRVFSLEGQVRQCDVADGAAACPLDFTLTPLPPSQKNHPSNFELGNIAKKKGGVSKAFFFFVKAHIVFYI